MSDYFHEEIEKTEISSFSPGKTITIKLSRIYQSICIFKIKSFEIRGKHSNTAISIKGIITGYETTGETEAILSVKRNGKINLKVQL